MVSSTRSEVSGREYSPRELALELTAVAVSRHSMSRLGRLPSFGYGDAEVLRRPAHQALPRFSLVNVIVVADLAVGLG